MGMSERAFLLEAVREFAEKVANSDESMCIRLEFSPACVKTYGNGSAEYVMIEIGRCLKRAVKLPPRAAPAAKDSP